MSIMPQYNPENPAFPGDSSPQPAFGFKDSLRSLLIWMIGAPHLALWAGIAVIISRISSHKKLDAAIKFMTRAVPALAGVRIRTLHSDKIDPDKTYVYVINHQNVFDMFAIYQAIPHYTRSLEHASHFDWPLFGTFITAAGQIPVDPANPRLTARGLKTAAEMLSQGDSLVVLPEGSRTLDGTVGQFYPGAFRLAIKAGVPVVPMALHGGRKISRRGDWRVRPGTMKVIFGEPIATEGLSLKDADTLGEKSRQAVISILQNENAKG